MLGVEGIVHPGSFRPESGCLHADVSQTKQQLHSVRQLPLSVDFSRRIVPSDEPNAKGGREELSFEGSQSSCLYLFKHLSPTFPSRNASFNQ